MAGKIALLFKKLVTKLVSSTRRFPEALFFAAATVSVLIALNHLDNNFTREKSELLTRIAMTLALGIPLSLSIKVLFERVPGLKRGIKAAVYLAVPVGLALYYLLLLKDLEMVSVTRYIAVSISLYCIFAFIPYYYKRPNYELYIDKLFTGFFITYLYSLTLFAGLAAILATIDALFGVNVSEDLYSDLLLLVAGVFAPAFFLSEIPERDEEIPVEEYPKVLKGLILYIVMPLIIVYAAILYVYFGKILITAQWPRGLVANLVLWYSLISTMVLFFIYPLREKNQWVKAFTAFFPKLIIPLLIMMFVAIGIRIKAYGITESRYYVVLAGLWVAGYMVYFILSRSPRNIVLPLSVAIIALLSVTGPWSCYSISKYSQNMRFERILNRYDMVENNYIARPAENISEEDKKELSAIILYFDRYHSLKELKYLPEDFTIGQSEKVLGFAVDRYGINVSSIEYFHNVLKEDRLVQDIEGYDYFIELSTRGREHIQVQDGPISIRYGGDSGELIISKDGQTVYSKNISEMACSIYDRNGEKASLDKEQMMFWDEYDGTQVLYIFRHIHGERNRSTGEININSSFYMFINFEE